MGKAISVAEWFARCEELQLQPEGDDLVGPCPACGSAGFTVRVTFRFGDAGAFSCPAGCFDGDILRAVFHGERGA